ncbi:exo-beta-1,3-glucanase [Coprinopsis cinerea okayama7|uniref:glucan 1,3-beta-glucosidase n=1 Tax=Coprinopsis cinerea (strain Okayama-7 / 130 / ATCC MYA-4618 / FGSC 9003) TaxID=240176 RepID=A8PG38_COPC7|nr:exo-beta-1,3-glucanase [Coprinopsis cinerea okayama7\|eukprot:XP_001841140.2 exo-beta-1,3-glucanase [Coprinopsis cinerea okayama7\
MEDTARAGSYSPFGTWEPSPRHSTGSKALLSEASSDGSVTKKPLHRRVWFIILFALTVIVVLFLAIFLPIYFTTIKHSDDSSPSSRGTARTGGNGSEITAEDGTKFVYLNPFGGHWVDDPDDPFNNDARPNSWTPPLNSSWKWGEDRIYGVNLGGLFVLEPFISPEIFQRYPGTKDEYELSEAMAADEANGGLSQLEEHYATFITEQDIAEIAGAGLNWIRVPIGFWAVETWEGEPFLERTSWKYFLRIIKWARKYGLRVALDLHAVPGSQNGYNHSGRLSQINFLAGNMGIANAQRTLYTLRVFTEFISQPEYRDVIQVIELVNEPLAGEIGAEALSSFYLEAYNMIRKITGTGNGNGPYIAISDGLQPLSLWDGLLPGGDRVIMDGHPYFAFGGINTAPITEPAEDGKAGGTWPKAACDNWGPAFNHSRRAIGPTVGGEFSAAPNDCGLFLRGVGIESPHPQCQEYDDWENYNATMKEGLESFITASFDALGDFFFWTWKIGPSIDGRVGTPLWSYKLGLENGWIPRDPRTSIGKCLALGGNQEPFDGAYPPYRTGADPSPTIPASYSSQYPWPPAAITGAAVPVELLPTYTNTASIVTLPVELPTGTPTPLPSGLDGWFNDDDVEGGPAEISGCQYPDRYTAEFSTIPTAPCTGPTPA